MKREKHIAEMQKEITAKKIKFMNIYTFIFEYKKGTKFNLITLL